LTAAFADPVERIPVVITFVTAASGTVIVGVSAAFWALLAGLAARLLLGKPPVRRLTSSVTA
jgi:benzoate membrane transport protein